MFDAKTLTDLEKEVEKMKEAIMRDASPEELFYHITILMREIQKMKNTLS